MAVHSESSWDFRSLLADSILRRLVPGSLATPLLPSFLLLRVWLFPRIAKHSGEKEDLHAAGQHPKAGARHGS